MIYFVTYIVQVFIFGVGVCIYLREVKIQYVNSSDHINTILTLSLRRHASQAPSCYTAANGYLKKITVFLGSP